MNIASQQDTTTEIDLPVETLRQMLYQMYLIRDFEEAAQQQYYAGKVHGTMHLFTGEEAVAVGARCSSRRSD